jgi:hypothetical protein
VGTKVPGPVLMPIPKIRVFTLSIMSIFVGKGKLSFLCVRKKDVVDVAAHAMNCFSTKCKIFKYKTNKMKKKLNVERFNRKMKLFFLFCL